MTAGRFLKHLIWYKNLTGGYLPSGNENKILKTYMYPTFTATVFTIAQMWKQPVLLSITVWTQWNFIQKDILFATWTNLEDIMPSAVSHTKPHIAWSCLYVESKNAKLTEMELWLPVAGTGGGGVGGNRQVLNKGLRFPVAGWVHSGI